MAIPVIHCHTQADKSTVPFAKFMWETMVSMANHPESLKLTVHCMNPGMMAQIDGWGSRNCQAITTPKKNEKDDPLKSSWGHGACAVQALGMTNDGNVHVVVDSDTVVIAKGWDDYLRKRLIDDGVGVVGVTYEDINGSSSGPGKVQTYKKIPTLSWVALSPYHDWRDLDVMPNKSHEIAVSTPQLAEIYNLPVGYSVFCDVGWQIPQYLHDRKLSYEGWRRLKPTRDAIVLKGLSDYHEEFHVGDTPFVVHHRGSRQYAYRSDGISRTFYAAVDNYLTLEVAKTARFKWNEPAELVVNTPVAVAGAEKAMTQQAEVHVPVGKEWMKVTFNGTAVIVPRHGVDRTQKTVQLEMTRPAVDRLGHLRVEGTLESDCSLTLPVVTAEPYVVTCCNLTGVPLTINSGKGSVLTLPASKTWFLLVDVDGVKRVE